MGREKYRLAFLLELLHQVAHFAASERIQARHGLVEENQFGIMQNRLRDSGALQHALRKLAQLHALHIGQSHALQHFFHAALAIFAGNAGELSVVVEQFVRGQVVVEIRLLGKKSDLRFDFRVGPFAAQDASRPGGREHQAHQHFQRCGLARAVGAEEAKNLSLFDREVERLQGALGPLAPESHHVGFFESEDFNCGHCPCPCCCRSVSEKIITKSWCEMIPEPVTTVTSTLKGGNTNALVATPRAC